MLTSKQILSNPKSNFLLWSVSADGISNRIRRPKVRKENKRFIKKRRKMASKQMKPIRERLRRGERILEKSPYLYELLKQEHELEKKAHARYKERGR